MREFLLHEPHELWFLLLRERYLSFPASFGARKGSLPFFRVSIKTFHPNFGMQSKKQNCNNDTIASLPTHHGRRELNFFSNTIRKREIANQERKQFYPFNQPSSANFSVKQDGIRIEKKKFYSFFLRPENYLFPRVPCCSRKIVGFVGLPRGLFRPFRPFF